MLVVVPLSALTDHTLRLANYCPGWLPRLPSRAPLTPRAYPHVPRALRQLLFVFPTYNLRPAKVRQIPVILLNITKVLVNFCTQLVYSSAIFVIVLGHYSDGMERQSCNCPIKVVIQLTMTNFIILDGINLVWVTRKTLINCYRI